MPRTVPQGAAFPTPAQLTLCFTLLFPLFYGAVSLAFGQDANWDFENYHWYNAYALLNGRIGKDILVSQTPSFYNPLIDVPFYLAATHLPARLVGFLLGAIQGLNGVLIFFLAHAVIRRPDTERTVWSIAVAVAGMIGGGTLGEVGAIFGDNIVSLGLFGGLLVLVPYALQPNRRPVWAALAGLLLGMAGGLKQPHLLYCAGIGLAVLFLPGTLTRRLTLAALVAAGGIAGIAATSGFWILHLAHDYGNPLFPYYNTVFQSPFGATNRDYRDLAMMPKTIWDAIAFPLTFTLNPYVAGEVGQRGPAILALFFTLPVAIWGLWRGRTHSLMEEALSDRAATRFLLAAMGLSYLAWLKMFAIYRYIVPLEMLAPLGVLISLGCIPGSARSRLIIAGTVLTLCAATSVRGDWGRVPWGNRYVEIKMPALAPNTMALMAGYEPIGFIATALPPEIPVLRIQSNFMHPDDTPSRFTDIMKARIAAHQGPLALIYAPQDKKNVDQALNEYRLDLDRNSCVPAPNSLDNRGIVLCTGVVKRPD